MKTTAMRCPDCDHVITPPADASGPTSRPCPACGYVLLLFTPRLDDTPRVTEAIGVPRRRLPWGR